jgi:hypothetical protein
MSSVRNGSTTRADGGWKGEVEGKEEGKEGAEEGSWRVADGAIEVGDAITDQPWADARGVTDAALDRLGRRSMMQTTSSRTAAKAEMPRPAVDGGQRRLRECFE